MKNTTRNLIAILAMATTTTYAWDSDFYERLAEIDRESDRREEEEAAWRAKARMDEIEDAANRRERELKERLDALEEAHRWQIQ